MKTVLTRKAYGVSGDQSISAIETRVDSYATNMLVLFNSD